MKMNRTSRAQSNHTPGTLAAPCAQSNRTPGAPAAPHALAARATLATPRRLAAALATVAAFALAPAPALATIEAVTGVDYLYPTVTSYTAPATEPADGSYVDLLSVTGDKGDLLYVDLLAADGTPLASHLAFQLDETTLVGDAAQDNGSYLCMLSLDASALDPTQTYTIRAWADRDETSPLYEGQVQVIFGLFEGQSEPTPIVVRTMGASDTDRGTPAPATIDLASSAEAGSGSAATSTVYELASTTPTTDAAGRTVYTYKLADTAPASVTGHVRYFRFGQTEPFRTDEIPAIAKGETRAVSVPEIVADGGTFLRTVLVGNTVSLSYPGTTEASIYCIEIQTPAGDSDWEAMGGEPYKASIVYHATTPDGRQLLADSLYVTRPYIYTPPTRLYTTAPDGETVQEWRLNAAASGLGEQGYLSFTLGAAADARTADLVYDLVSDDAEVTWTVQCVSGDKETAGQQLAKPLVLTADQLTADEDGNLSYTPAETLEANGTTYTRAQQSIAVNRMGGVVTAYYVSGTGAREDYTINVRYVDIAATDGSALETHQVEITYATAEAGSDQAIPVPESLQEGTYVLVPGQLYDASEVAGCRNLYHSYYAPGRTYTIYYRNINDELHATTVITRINTIYDDVIVTNRGVVAGGTTGTGTDGTAGGAGGTGAGGTGADGTGAAGLSDTGGLNAIEGGEGGSDLVRDDGTGTGEERIDDEQNPLAGPDSGSAVDPTTAGALAPQMARIVNGAVGFIGGLAAVLLILCFLRRKKEEKEEK